MPLPISFIQRKRLPAYFISELKNYYDEREARNLANWVIEDLTGKRPMEVLTEEEDWGGNDQIRIADILESLKSGDPIQYILGYSEFFGLEFQLSPGVLIPRNETEELVEWVLSNAKNHDPGCRILDIGCGSGAISITLAKNLPDAMVYAADISDIAQRISIINAEIQSVNYLCGRMDILNPKGKIAEREYDVIVSNPPYVLESQKPFLEKRVTEKEPSMALFVPDTDPLIYYRAIASFAQTRLRPGGRLYVEINEQLPKETLREFDKFFSSTELRKDIHGRYRMIKASNGEE